MCLRSVGVEDGRQICSCSLRESDSFEPKKQRDRHSYNINKPTEQRTCSVALAPAPAPVCVQTVSHAIEIATRKSTIDAMHSFPFPKFVTLRFWIMDRCSSVAVTAFVRRTPLLTCILASAAYAHHQRIRTAHQRHRGTSISPSSPSSSSSPFLFFLSLPLPSSTNRAVLLDPCVADWGASKQPGREQNHIGKQKPLAVR